MRRRSTRANQAGFSMVEMLMAAFILSVGILGITMLQVVSLRTARGGQNLTTAIQVAERVMDQVELEGRLSWLNITDSQYSTPGTTTPLTHLQYINNTTVPDQTFNISGQPAAIDPVDTTPVFTMHMVQNLVSTGTDGKVTDVQVLVTFTDMISTADNTTPIKRTVNLTRRIVHG